VTFIDIGFLAVMALVLYLFILRPTRERQKQFAALRAMQESLRPGTRVMTSSGIHGTVHHVDEETVGLEVAPGVVIEVARAAIAEAEGTGTEDPQA